MSHARLRDEFQLAVKVMKSFMCHAAFIRVIQGKDYARVDALLDELATVAVTADILTVRGVARVLMSLH